MSFTRKGELIFQFAFFISINKEFTMGRKAANRKHQQQIIEMSNMLHNNINAQMDGPKRKKWSSHDLKNIQPMTDRQRDMFECFFSGQHVCAYGSAGVGKTYIAMYLALREVLDKDQPQDHVIIVRTTVQGRDQGHMPGTKEEKEAMFELPYKDILWDLIGRASTYDDMKEVNLVRFMSTSAIRGLTWDNAIIVIDEFQNMTWSEFDSIVTRVGVNSKLIVCGDIHHQCDLKKHEESGAQKAMKVMQSMDKFGCIQFTKDDIVRSEFVKKWIEAREKLGL